MAKKMRKVVGPGFQVAGAAKRIQAEKRGVSDELNKRYRTKMKKDRMRGAK